MAARFVYRVESRLNLMPCCPGAWGLARGGISRWPATLRSELALPQYRSGSIVPPRSRYTISRAAERAKYEGPVRIKNAPRANGPAFDTADTCQRRSNHRQKTFG